MSHESLTNREIPHEIDLTKVPDWHIESGSGLWEFVDPLDTITVAHQSHVVEVPPDIVNLRQLLESHTSPTFFNRPMANLERLSFSNRGMELETSVTDFFTYLASSYAHRQDQGVNPIRTLAVQATVLSPDGSKLIMERRSEKLADHPNQLWVVGGILEPKKKPEEALRQIVNRKYGLDLVPDQLHPTGLARDNSSNIYCLTYTIDLTPDQYTAGHTRATAANQAGTSRFYQISTDETRRSIEQMVEGKRPMRDWDPNGLFNILYALGAKCFRTKQQLDALVATANARTVAQPIEYTYPMEKYLPK